MVVTIAAMCFLAADWPCFRGPKSSGASDDAAGPTRWTATDVVLWKTALPGFGASSPITWDGKVFVTSYNGYGLDEDNPGRQEDLRMHLTSLNLSDGSVALGAGDPAGDSRAGLPRIPGDSRIRLGHAGHRRRAGLRGRRTVRGAGLHDGGSAGLEDKHRFGPARVGLGHFGCTPRRSGDCQRERRKRGDHRPDQGRRQGGLAAEGIRQSWSTPLVAAAVGGREELVVSTQGKALGLDPNTGAQLWECESVDDFVCPSVIAHGEWPTSPAAGSRSAWPSASAGAAT